MKNLQARRSAFATIPAIIFLIITMCVSLWSQPDPERTVGLIDNNGAYPGYNLFAPYRGYHVYLIDNNGNLLHQWEDPDRLSPGAPVYLTEKGTLVKACFIDNLYAKAGPAAGRGGSFATGPPPRNS